MRKAFRLNPLIIIPHYSEFVKEKKRLNMKICAIICEYNPFHNGHAHHIAQAKRLSGADAVVCIMSGNFVQRGEAAILGKYTRAKHAVLSGADAVIELPCVFATSPAEIFAKGGVKIATALNASSLAFGVENGTEADFIRAAKLLSVEPESVSKEIKRLLGEGYSYAKARSLAWKDRFPDGFLSSPNNILAIEYAKAVLQSGANIKLIPGPRIGGAYLDETLSENFSSATAIRKALEKGEKEKLSSQVPPFAFVDLPKKHYDTLESAEKIALISTPTNEIKQTLDCTEGLENALKKAVTAGVSNIAEHLTSKRYTTSRIRRIMLQNLLKISASFVEECLNDPLYGNLLAIKKENTSLLSAFSKDFPLLVRAYDENGLTGVAKKCRDCDRFADTIFTLVRNLPPERKNVFI